MQPFTDRCPYKCAFQSLFLFNSILFLVYIIVLWKGERACVRVCMRPIWFPSVRPAFSLHLFLGLCRVSFIFYRFGFLNIFFFYGLFVYLFLSMNDVDAVFLRCFLWMGLLVDSVLICHKKTIKKKIVCSITVSLISDIRTFLSNYLKFNLKQVNRWYNRESIQGWQLGFEKYISGIFGGGRLLYRFRPGTSEGSYKQIRWWSCKQTL